MVQIHLPILEANALYSSWLIIDKMTKIYHVVSIRYSQIWKVKLE